MYTLCPTVVTMILIMSPVIVLGNERSLVDQSMDLVDFGPYYGTMGLISSLSYATRHGFVCFAPNETPFALIRGRTFTAPTSQ